MASPQTTPDAADPAPPGSPPSIADIRRLLSVLFTDEQLIELRAPRHKSGQNIVSRFGPGEIDQAAARAAELSGSAPAVYVVLNSIRQGPRIGLNVKVGAKAEDIVRRRWMLVDVDPERPVGTNATEAEKFAARMLQGQVYD
jgi:hypothetical protein